jgi:glutamate/tyrosine decarboxylase-like PLP-dependent enzyme
VEGLELADSITGDAHKLLNVPYDCGFFFSRHPNLAQQVFQNANAAYLNSTNTPPGKIQSALNIGIENSRRFRALPVYATLVAYGRLGYRDMLHMQIRLARAIALFFHEHPDFELLPKGMSDSARIKQDIYVIVLFKAKDQSLNESLVKRINSTSRIYVSGTMWNGSQASRIAVANWQVDPGRDSKLVQSVIEDVLSAWRKEVG